MYYFFHQSRTDTQRNQKGHNSRSVMIFWGFGDSYCNLNFVICVTFLLTKIWFYYLEKKIPQTMHKSWEIQAIPAYSPFLWRRRTPLLLCDASVRFCHKLSLMSMTILIVFNVIKYCVIFIDREKIHLFAIMNHLTKLLRRRHT